MIAFSDEDDEKTESLEAAAAREAALVNQYWSKFVSVL